MKLLVTGAAGFIGSNFVHYMFKHHSDIEIVAFDLLTYSGNLANLKTVFKNPSFKFIHGDISDFNVVASVVEGHRPDAIINFAAESHVDRSIHFGAEVFIKTNVLGVQVLLDICREFKVGRFVQISTDEVYGSLGPEGKFKETDPLLPNNPYSASKAAADMLVRAAVMTYKLDAVITRCSNNFGPYQFPEKLIPLTIINAIQGKPIPIYGDGLYVRDWIYVLDHCEAIDLVLNKGKPGEVYNIGGMHDITNIELIYKILDILNAPRDLIRFVKDRPGHDRRYAMDCSFIEETLGWYRKHNFDESLRETVRWYIENQQWWKDIQNGSYKDYYNKMYGDIYV